MSFARDYAKSAERGRQPKTPTLFSTAGTPPQAFDDLAGLCLKLQAMRGKRGLQARPSTFCWPGFDTMQGFTMYAFDKETGGEEWLGAVMIQGRQFVALQQAMRQAGVELRMASLAKRAA